MKDFLYVCHSLRGFRASVKLEKFELGNSLEIKDYNIIIIIIQYHYHNRCY